ncbi:MAG: phosphoribosylglycinamide formyltransferase [Planctomycetota bacterium]
MTKSTEHSSTQNSPAPGNDASGNPLRLGFLLSGGGRTLENLVSYLEQHGVPAEIVVVISDRDDAFGLERARRLGIDTAVMPCSNSDDSATIFTRLEAAQVDFVLLGGFLRLLVVPPTWERRVLNIHPSLIPAHSGKGYYGMRVHRSVLAAGDKQTGCTVHFVDNVYDHGPILLQETVPVLPDDDADAIANRVFEAECRAFPRAIELLANGGVDWQADGSVRVTESS